MLLVQFRGAVLLSIKQNPRLALLTLFSLQRRLNRGVVELVMRLNAGCRGVNRQGELEGRKRIRIGNVFVVLQELHEGFIQLFLGGLVVEVAVGYAIKEGEVGCRILVCCRFSSQY